MGTRILQILSCDSDGLISEFGGAKRDRTADLLHAMQALSQLSYGPTCYCEPAIMAKFRLKWKLFLPERLGGAFSNKTRETPKRFTTSMNGVPTGIRTPVATVKG
jgi:hypothetical protein